jgi:aspartate/methionine/tyrosine aminotransferase
LLYSKRVDTVRESQTAKIAAIAIQMKRDKFDVVDFTVGEPDFPSPQNIRNAAITAINNGKATYTLITGIVELRKAIQKKLKKDNHLDYEIDNIIVSTGAKQSIFNAILAIVEKDEEVIIPAPYWVSYPEMVSIAEGKSVIIDTDESQEFKLTPQQLADNITDKTKAIILCNPSNPTGAIYSRSELKSLAAVLEDKNIVVISDEIYEKLTYDNLEHVSLAALSSSMKSKTLVINGFSKAYAMTGWRIGYAAGDKELIKRMAILQGHSTTNAPAIAQYAGIEALEGSQEELALMHSEFEKRRDFVFNRLQSMEGISCFKPRGAFYAFPNISAHLSTSYNEYEIKNSSDLALYLIKEAKVVLIPGSAFGSDNHLRISFATSMERLKEGMDRIENALSNLE